MLAAACALAVPAVVHVQGIDICGCATLPDLQPFDSTISSSWPPGTTDANSTLTIPLPPDGVLRFSSFRATTRNITFAPNAANTPVTLLVAGDVTLSRNVSACCLDVEVGGARGSNGTAQTGGFGGRGGPGGFRGGDGANQVINAAAVGGAGFGPGGGSSGAPSACPGGNGQFLGVPELLPLVGGSGGGGGCSSAASSTSCSAGGGGGGGGAILIVANGTITLNYYRIFADGANGGTAGSSGCSSAGGYGAGGAIRLVANRFVGTGTNQLYARGGEGNGGIDGRIRLESVDASAQTAFTVFPFALRTVGPMPLTNPLAPTVNVTAVGGAAVPPILQGPHGGIDIVVPVPGVTTIDVATSGVPSGTTVEVNVKPRLGAPPVSQTVPLTDCNVAGDCQATTTFNLPAGAYVVEARATFEAQ
jgi:hypothetical protein